MHVSANYFFLESPLAICTAQSPIFYPPIASDQPIYQFYTPPNFPCMAPYLFESQLDQATFN